jgi:hypothetical protein
MTNKLTRTISGEDLFKLLGRQTEDFEGCYPIFKLFQDLAGAESKRTGKALYPHDLGYSCFCMDADPKFAKSHRDLKDYGCLVGTQYILKTSDHVILELFQTKNSIGTEILYNPNRSGLDSMNYGEKLKHYLQKIGGSIFSKRKTTGRSIRPIYCDGAVLMWGDIFKISRIRCFPREFQPLWTGPYQTGDVYNNDEGNGEMCLGVDKNRLVSMVISADSESKSKGEIRCRDSYNKVFNIFI